MPEQNGIFYQNIHFAHFLKLRLRKEMIGNGRKSSRIFLLGETIFNEKMNTAMNVVVNFCNSKSILPCKNDQVDRTEINAFFL